ncbi:MAG: ThuA domain-containing protein [Pseudomonadota bacterium]
MIKQPLTCYFVISGKYHDIDFARLEVLKLLAEHDQIRTIVTPDYSDIDAICAADFLITFTCDVMPTDAQTQKLNEYVTGGGKWIALHGTNSILEFTEEGLVDSPETAPEFMELVGTQFKAHPPIGPFQVEVVDDQNPLSEGMTDFEVIDELYLSKTFSDIHILMQTRFTGEATGFVDLNWEDEIVPIAYLRDVGDGQIFYCTLGHCRGHYDVQVMTPFYPHTERCAWNYPIFYEVLRRSIKWAMGTL